jgi:hypothetical protein
MGDNMIGFQRLAQNQYISPDLLVILKLFFKGFQRLTLQSTLFPGLPVIKLSSTSFVLILKKHSGPGWLNELGSCRAWVAQ